VTDDLVWDAVRRSIGPDDFDLVCRDPEVQKIPAVQEWLAACKRAIVETFKLPQELRGDGVDGPLSFWPPGSALAVCKHEQLPPLTWDDDGMTEADDGAPI